MPRSSKLFDALSVMAQLATSRPPWTNPACTNQPIITGCCCMRRSTPRAPSSTRCRTDRFRKTTGRAPRFDALIDLGF
jgi:hypothetical protein